MRDFKRKRWSPAGARPHVLLDAYPLVKTGFAAEYIGDYRSGLPAPWPALAQWYPDWPDILYELHPFTWHVTLAWLDDPAVDIPQDHDKVHVALWEPVNQLDPVTLTARQFVVTTHGIQIQLERTPELDTLATIAVDGMRTVYGADAPIWTPGPDWQPHVMVYRGIRDAETPTGPLPTVSGPVACITNRVRVLYVDTFPPNPHVHHPVRKIDTERIMTMRSGRPAWHIDHDPIDL